MWQFWNELIIQSFCFRCCHGTLIFIFISCRSKICQSVCIGSCYIVLIWIIAYSFVKCWISSFILWITDHIIEPVISLRIRGWQLYKPWICCVSYIFWCLCLNDQVKTQWQFVFTCHTISISLIHGCPILSHVIF